jgi:hypothetical protein
MMLIGKCPTCAGAVRMSVQDVRYERIVICENGHPVQLRSMTKPVVPGSPRRK